MNRHDPPEDLVSIVIPVFNGARLVGEAIESALAQSWPSTEIIVVDDGSNDEGATQRVLAGFGDAIRVVSKANGGVATALNAGIAAMRGRWFSWLSHDDLYHPLKVERYLAAMRKAPGPAIVFGDVDMVDEDGSLLGRNELTKGFQGTDGRWAALEGRLNGCAMLVPRACLEACGGFDPLLPTTQDYAYWFQLGQRYPFHPLHESLVRSRVHAEQGSRTTRHLEEASLLWAWMLDQLESAPPDETLRRLLRIVRVLRTISYAGARALVEERLDRLLAGHRVSAVIPASSGRDLDAVRSALLAVGVMPGGMAVLDGAKDAPASLDLAMEVQRRGGTFVRLAAPSAPVDLSDALRLASGLDGFATAFLDPAALPDAETLREGLLAILADEIDGWLSGAAVAGSALPLELSGAVLRRDAVRAAARDPTPSAALLRDARLTQAGVSSPRPPAPRTMPKPQPASGPLPALGWTPQPGAPTLLMFVHGWGGGTIRYAETLTTLIARRCNVLFAWGVENRRFYLSSIGPEAPEWVYDLTDGLPPLLAALRELAITRIDVLHDVGFETFMDDFLDGLGAPFDVTFLDYHLVTHGFHLTDSSGRFVGDASLLRPGHPAFRTGLPRLTVRAAERRIACSRDLAGRIARLVPGLQVTAARLPEPGNPAGFATHGPPLADGEVMRVLYLGLMAPHKGVELIPEVVRRANAQGVDLCVYCLGADASYPSVAQQEAGVRLLGSYAQDELNTLICRLRPHLAWLPFTAPETHSFSVSDAMLQGLPILATGIGAVPERLESRPSTWLLTPEEASIDGFASWFARLRRDRLTTPPRWQPTAHLPPLTAGFYERDYLRPLFRSA